MMPGAAQGPRYSVNPSGRARSCRKFSALAPPAPGMFFTITFGSPGMCFGQCLTNARVSRSSPLPPGTGLRTVIVLPSK